jgi:hypothetical protein
MAIITTAEYKTYAGITSNTDDTFIGLAISAAQSMAESYTGRTFDAGNFVDIIDGNVAQANAQVKSWPINTLTSVEYRSGTQWITFQSDIYTFEPETGLIWIRSPVWGRVSGTEAGWLGDGDGWSGPQYGIGTGPSPRIPEGQYNLRVTYNGGYAFANMPAELKWAMYQMVDVLFTNRARNPMLQSESIMSYSYSLGSKNGKPVTVEDMVASLFGSFTAVA